MSMTKLLITWNIILSLIVGLLFWNMSYDERSTYDIAQDTVICGYVTDLQLQTGTDRTVSPDCQGDIEKIFQSITN